MASRYLPVYIAIALLVVVASIWAPATLSGPALSAIAPFGTFLAITALGQMLVIMTGGIDLSVPGTFTLAAVVTVGVGQTADDDLWTAIGIALVARAPLVGLVNGILIGGLGLNALIVTLAVGQIVSGIAFRYYTTVAIQTPVPPRPVGVDLDAVPRGHPDLLGRRGDHPRAGRRSSGSRRPGGGSRSSARTPRRRRSRACG